MSFGINFEALGHWDSISETLGSEGVKGYFIHRLSGSIESHFGDLSVPFFVFLKQASLFVFCWLLCWSFCLTFNALGCNWDSNSETLGSEGVKGYLGPLLLGFLESHVGGLSVLFFETGLLF